MTNRSVATASDHRARGSGQSDVTKTGLVMKSVVAVGPLASTTVVPSAADVSSPKSPNDQIAATTAGVAEDNVCMHKELAVLEFEAVLEFAPVRMARVQVSLDCRAGTDGRLPYLAFCARLTFGLVGKSKLELIERVKEDAVDETLEMLSKGQRLANTLEETMCAAEIRVLCATANWCMEEELKDAA
jgi:hypothetical protein